MLLGDGSATYSITLPLDATGMAVSELEILVGPDPSMVLGDQGQMPGSGRKASRSRCAIRRPATGTFSATSAARRTSRSTIRAPPSAAAGASRCASPGSSQIPNFGQPSVFVSARATGVIGE